MSTRRGFMAGLLATGLAPQISWADAGRPRFLSAAREENGQYVLCGLSELGEILFKLPLPDRGHAAASHPSRPEAVCFARRPGRFAFVIDCMTGVPVYLDRAAPELDVVSIGQSEDGLISGVFDVVIDSPSIGRPDPCLAFQSDG